MFKKYVYFHMNLLVPIMVSGKVEIMTFAPEPGKYAPQGRDYLLYSVKHCPTDLWAIVEY